MEGGHLRLVEKEIQHLDMLNSNEMNGQNCTYNVIYKQAPKKKQAIFHCQNPAPPRILPTSPSKLEILFLVATAVTLSIAFLAPIGETCKSHVNVHGHSDKMYHQLMATQVKSPRKSLATEAAHSFMQDLH
jgi:hypothetical protein